MVKVLSDLYDNPVDGISKKHARDDVPSITKYHDEQSAPTPKAIDFKPVETPRLIARTCFPHCAKYAARYLDARVRSLHRLDASAHRHAARLHAVST